MNYRLGRISGAVSAALAAGMIALPASAVFAQQTERGDDIQRLEAIQVTGSRIKRAEIEGQTPVQVITAADIEATGLGSIGDVIQRLSVSGSSLNTKFNSAGNFGFSPDGSGVGSGSTTISLRNLGAKHSRKRSGSHRDPHRRRFLAVRFGCHCRCGQRHNQEEG